MASTIAQAGHVSVFNKSRAFFIKWTCYCVPSQCIRIEANVQPNPDSPQKTPDKYTSIIYS